MHRLDGTHVNSSPARRPEQGRVHTSGYRPRHAAGVRSGTRLPSAIGHWMGNMDLVLGEIDLATVKLHTLSVWGRCCWTGWYTSATGYSSLRWTHTVWYGAHRYPRYDRALPMLATAMLRCHRPRYGDARLATYWWKCTTLATMHAPVELGYGRTLIRIGLETQNIGIRMRPIPLLIQA